MIQRLAHACFTVKDLDAAAAFYEDRLGMEHAFDFIMIHQVQQPPGDRHNGMLRVAPGGKGIGCVFGNDVYLWHGKPCIFSQRFDHPVDLRRLFGTDLLGTIHFQNNFI